MDIHQLRNDPLAMELVRARARYFRRVGWSVENAWREAIEEQQRGGPDPRTLVLPGRIVFTNGMKRWQ